MIKIQKEDFISEDEINFIRSKHSNIGSVSTFIGYVRGLNNQKKVTSIKIEVYEEMAYKSLNEISKKAQEKWNLINTLIVHRFGNLNVNEKIVLVAAFSSHRKDSFAASSFMMEYLKQEAPFWKKEFYDNDYQWLENSKLMS